MIGKRQTGAGEVGGQPDGGAAFAGSLFRGLRRAPRIWLLEAQLDAYFARVLFALIGNLLNALILVWLFHETIAFSWLASWTSVLVGLSAVRLFVHVRRASLLESRGPSWLARYTLGEGIWFGGTWAVAIATMMPHASPLQVAILSMVAAGMMSGGTFTFAVLPAAARIYVAVLAVGTCVGFVSREASFAVPAVLLLASYGFMLNRSIGSSFGDFAERVERERELADTAKTVKILLNEYEAFGSDWLWEVDADGRLWHVNERLAAAMERVEADLEGTAFLALFVDSPEKATLREHLATGQPFRNVAVQLKENGKWWKLSAGPIGEAGAAGGFAMRGVATDITSSKKAQARIAHMALNDALTGLPNRASFSERIDHEIEHAAVTGGKVALIAIDLDRFKEINDLQGHGAGDEVLRTLAQRMHAALGDGEFLARIGGDEFSAIQRFQDQAMLEDMLARLEAALREPIRLDDYEVVPGASIGVAIYPDDADNRASLVSNADLAMYRAKGNLAKAVCFYEQSMDESVRSRRALANDLRDAVANNRLTLYYQVQTSVSTGEIKGYEALLRWFHPERGFIPPAEFIPLAEENGLILRLGEWVLRTACREAASWEPAYKVAINLSPVQFAHTDLPRLVLEVLLETGLSPDRLELELTESTIFADRERSLHMLRQIKALGVSIALDDFGTGYSSLDTLRSFPFDKIKLDRSFMTEIESSPEAKAIIRAVLALGKSLRIPVLPEGIETQGQLTLLTVEGCDEAQGYLLGRPAPLDAILDSGQLVSRNPRGSSDAAADLRHPDPTFRLDKRASS